MPNHVTNRLVITGPAESIRELVQEVAGPEDSHFCLNRIMPMPKVLLGTESGSRAHWGLIALGRTDLTASMFGDPLKNPWCEEKGIYSAEDLKAFLEKEHPDYLEEANKQIEAHTAIGFRDWYDWSVSNWGTKWDAYHQSMITTEDNVTFQFDTAWSPPIPVIEELVGLFPELNFVHSYFDEGHFFWGEARYVNGECEEDRQSEEQDRVRLCIELEGYDPDKEEDEDSVPGTSIVEEIQTAEGGQ